MTFTPTHVLWGISSIQSRPCAPTVHSCSLACVPLLRALCYSPDVLLG